MNKVKKKTISTRINTVKHFCVLKVLCAALLFVHDFAAGGFGLRRWTTIEMYLYCCTVHLIDSLNITLPTNALIVCHLF